MRRQGLILHRCIPQHLHRGAIDISKCIRCFSAAPAPSLSKRRSYSLLPVLAQAELPKEHKTLNNKQREQNQLAVL